MLLPTPNAMLLPTPNAEETRRFQQLYRSRFGVELDERAAFHLATALVRFVYLTDNPDAPVPPKGQLLETKSPSTFSTLSAVNSPSCATSSTPANRRKRKTGRFNPSKTRSKL